MTSIGDGSPDDSLLVIEDIPQHGHQNDLDDLESTSISNSYCGEWEKLFKVPDFQTRLRSYGIHGKLRSSRFRSVCWKFYLEVLGKDYDEWINETRAWRDKYEELKQQLIVNPRKSENGSDLSLNNPLSQELESPWNQFFQDNELRVTIKQDVIRTYPKIEFFHTDHIRTMMVDVLFIYAKLKPDIAYRQDNKLQHMMIDILFAYCKQHESLSYKQGMHELLAPLIFVLHCDHQAFLHACEIESIGEVIKEILNPDFVEHDAYAMFYQIMQTVEPWYVSKEISPPVKMNNVHLAQPFARNQDLHPSNVIVTKLTRIQDYLLKKHDPELYAYLEKMDIPPQIYGIRWVRLLFGREFPMQDLLMLWDAIFADSINFDLVDFIFVGMMLYIRDAMLTSDYPSCLHLLMKYPPVGDVHYFVDKALYLREPNQYPRPPNYAFQKPANFGHGWGNGDGQNNRNKHRPSHINIAEKAANVVSGLSTLTRRMNKGIQQHNMKMSISPHRMSKSTSEPMNLITDQSPEDDESLPGHVRKGSTASMSQIEGMYYKSPSPLRSAASTQSLARTESLKRHASSSSRHSHEMDEVPHLNTTHTKLNTHKHGHERSVDQQLAIALGRIHDLDRICLMCADKMDVHLDKLQQEILKQGMANEDEMLLSLAGLKQVRDVLKGTLKPNNLLDNEEISIHDNHYYDQPLSLQDSRHSSSFCSPHTETSVSNAIDAAMSTSGYDVLPSSDTDISLPPQMGGSTSSGTTGSPDTSPASGGTPEYLSNPSSAEAPQYADQSTTMPSLSPSQKEIELKDYLVEKYFDHPDHSALTDQGQGSQYQSTNQGLGSADGGVVSQSLSNQREVMSQRLVQQRSSNNCPSYGSQNGKQPLPHGQKYHSAPPTPLDTINSRYEDFDQPMVQQTRDTSYSSQSASVGIRRHNSSKQFDPNQNTRKGPSLNFWGQRASPTSKENSAMNKLTDLFKGTFKF